jgi:hypothetical protein
VLEFAQWLAGTSLSLGIQTRLWIIPTVQSVHIVAIGLVLVSVLMMNLRILGLSGRDQSSLETSRRFGPWLWSALSVLLVTGIVMVIGEPVRELLSFSFWFKMTLIVIGSAVAIVFQTALARDLATPGTALKSLAVVTLFTWCGVVVLGRLIAYDHVWGAWSLAPIQ